MDIENILNWLQKFIEEMIDDMINHDISKVQKRVSEFQCKYFKLSKEEIAKKIVEDQSFWGGLLAVPTGLGGVLTLPVGLSLDLIKYLRVQAYMICCLRHLYGYSLEDKNAIKTDLFLLMSHSSIDNLKDFVCYEAEKQVKDDFCKKEAFAQIKKLDVYKNIMVKTGQNLGVKHGAKVVIRFGEKQVMNYALRGVPKMFRGIIWRLGGRKIAEKTMQKTVNKVVPVIGAFVGAGVDWWLIKATGHLAIKYYEIGGPDFLDAVYGLLE